MLFLNRVAPVNIIQEVGGRSDLSGIIINVSSAVSVMFTVQKVAYSKPRMVFSWQTWIIARAAAFARMNAGPARYRW